jgi:hypothetical protein
VTRPTRLDPERPLYAARLAGWREHGNSSLCGTPIYREIAGGRATPGDNIPNSIPADGSRLASPAAAGEPRGVRRGPQTQPSRNGGRYGSGVSGSWAAPGLVVLVVDVVSAVLKCRALPGAAATLLAVPSAGALGAKYLRRVEAQSQIADPDLVLDGHVGSVGCRTDACDQRNKLLGRSEPRAGQG